MKKLLVLSIIPLTMLSCGKKTEKTTATASEDTTTAAQETPADLSIKSECYIGATGKDSVFVSVDNNLGTVTGKMFYKNSEKDSSKGDLVGYKNGDTLKLTYEFQSEGRTSKRDIFFIQKDGTLMEGIGNQKDADGQMVYENEKNISYKDGQKLEKADCKTVLKALK